MSTLTIVALVLGIVVVVAAYATRRRKPADPLARATRRRTRKRRPFFMGLAATDIEKAAFAIHKGRKDEAVALLRENLDPDDARRVADEIEAQLAGDGPLRRLFEAPQTPPSPKSGLK
jgi:hypothetical protein